MKHQTKKLFTALPVIIFAALALLLGGACGTPLDDDGDSTETALTAGGGSLETEDQDSYDPEEDSYFEIEEVTDDDDEALEEGEEEILLEGQRVSATAMACKPKRKIIYLRAEPYLKKMKDGSTVAMWGYARETKKGKKVNKPSSPGPKIKIGECIPELVIRVNNQLPVPTSLVINGLSKPMTPVYNIDGRVRSLDVETAPGATVSYTWLNPPAGIYLYQSGTQMQVQVQMGLFGGLWKKSIGRFIYPGLKVGEQALLIYSEIDPDLHAAVATGNYGPTGTMTSTINYKPKYFLINGKPYRPGAKSKFSSLGGGNGLVRLLNAGLKSRTIMFLNGRVQVVAEDSHAYPYPQQLNSVLLEAGKSKDILVPKGTKVKFVIDRALGF